ncbi:MAG: tRNA (adenosine(37)-N6)-dimethylallyltransferase MiaA [Gammaproteobacteria bacterium]|nr:tRNA (adenosine(37)-N6)-dimethylallyltransferase MiaA [Gammaproteobacteria bacterium]
MESFPRAIFLMGPTAAGKTDLALALIKYFPCEIISVDSAMVYRGMDIGTAKPAAEVLAQAPHRLLDICDPAESYSAAQFRNDALVEMEAICAKSRIPLLTGGTGLYFRALEYGLSELPSADPAIRQSLSAEAARAGWPALHERLAGIDPQAARRIEPKDSQRIQRALEVYEISGCTMTSLLARNPPLKLPYNVVKLVLAPPRRDILHDRIQRRFEAMLVQGLVEEVKFFFNRGDLHADLPAMRAVGYRQVWRYLAGETNYAEMVEQAVIATRQLAKRQLTWLRAEKNAVWFDSARAELMQSILKYLKSIPIQESR